MSFGCRSSEINVYLRALADRWKVEKLDILLKYVIFILRFIFNTMTEVIILTFEIWARLIQFRESQAVLFRIVISSFLCQMKCCYGVV